MQKKTISISILTLALAQLLWLPISVNAFSLTSGSESDLCTAPTYSDEFQISGRFLVNNVLLPGHEKYEFKPEIFEYQNLPLSTNKDLNKILNLKISDSDAAKIPTDRVVKLGLGNYKAFCEGHPQADFLSINNDFQNVQGGFTLISGSPNDVCSNPTFLGEEMISGQFAASGKDDLGNDIYKFILDEDQRSRLPLPYLLKDNPDFNKEVTVINAGKNYSTKLEQPISVIIDQYAAACQGAPLARLKTGFSDVAAQNQYSDEIQFLKTLNILNGYSDGTFRPNKSINRAEFTKIIMSTAIAESDFLPAESCFSDVNKDDWFAKYVCTAKATNIIAGYSDNTFKPNQTISLAEALKIILKVNGVDYTQTPVWYEGLMAKAKENGLITFSPATPDTKITRAQMADIIALTIRKRNQK